MSQSSVLQPLPVMRPLPAPPGTNGASGLTRFALFAQMADLPLSRLSREATRHRFQAGERIWCTGGKADHFTLIEDGIVEIERTKRSGDGVILGLFASGETVGLPAVIAHKPYPADAIALSDRVDIIRIRAPAMLQVMREHLPLTLAVNQALLQHNAALRASLEIVGAGSVPKRLAALFLFLGRRFGNRTVAGELHINLALTREQIGRLVSARVETVIRIISRWQKAGWLRGGREGIEITRVDMLQRMSDAG